MTKSVEKEIDLNKIIDRMYQKFGKDGLSEVEKARYLYIELGKLFRYNMDYLTLYARKQEDIYFDVVDFDNIKSNAWTCVQMSDIYVEALKRVGIQARTQRDVRGDDAYEFIHRYTIIDFSDERTVMTDLIYDLPFIQLGMKTNYFASKTYEENTVCISDDEIKIIDDKIGYTFGLSDDEKNYTEAFLEMIQKELANPELMKAYVKNVYDGEEYKSENLIEYKLDLISRFFGLEDMGFYEGSRILGMFYREFFTEEERKRLSFSLYRKEPYENHRIGDVEELACYCFKKTKDSCRYYVYEEGEGLISLSREDIIEKIKTFDKIYSKNLDKSEYGDDI